jgi:allantoinase
MNRTRNFIGYGETPPDPSWPDGARIAINLNLNFEGGGERSLDNGDDTSEGMLNDIGMPAYTGLRSPLAESAFEYGSRTGVWRILRVLRSFGVKASILSVVAALERNPEAARAFVRDGHELVCHGYRWLDYQVMPVDEERKHVDAAVRWFESQFGMTSLGWMTGRPSVHTRELIAATGRILYDRDELNDELPYWTVAAGKPHLIIPYSFETNDNRFNENSGFSVARHFAEYMTDCFDTLYVEAGHRPTMMSIGLHDRLIGRPARIKGLVDFLRHACGHRGVWFCTGAQIAHHWRKTFAPTDIAGL